MAGRSSKTKGKGGEYEARDLITSWLAPVYEECGLAPPVLRRNLEQVRGGGFDLDGVDWLALEVKRQETPQLPAWWRQTVGNAGRGQVPVLMWRQNRQPWRFRARVRVWVGHETLAPLGLDADLDAEQARQLLQAEAWWRLH